MHTPNQTLNWLLKDVRASWKYQTPDLWPKVDSSKIFVLEAVNKVGRSEYGEKWTDDELSADITNFKGSPLEAYYSKLAHDIGILERSQYTYIPQSLADNDVRSPQPSKFDFERKKAEDLSDLRRLMDDSPEAVLEQQKKWDDDLSKVERLRHVARWIGDRARDGKLLGYYQAAGDRDPHPLLPANWNCTDDLRDWLINAGREIIHRSSLGDKPVDATFFLCSKSLDNALSSSAHAPLLVDRVDISRLAPDLQLAVRVALQQKLFSPGVMPDGQVQDKIIAAAKAENREIKNTKAVQMSATMRWPNSSIKTSDDKKS